MSRLHFEEARTEEQFAALSLIHALGWADHLRRRHPRRLHGPGDHR